MFSLTLQRMGNEWRRNKYTLQNDNNDFHSSFTNIFPFIFMNWISQFGLLKQFHYIHLIRHTILYFSVWKITIFEFEFIDKKQFDDNFRGKNFETRKKELYINKNVSRTQKRVCVCEHIDFRRKTNVVDRAQMLCAIRLVKRVRSVCVDSGVASIRRHGSIVSCQLFAAHSLDYLYAHWMERTQWCVRQHSWMMMCNVGVLSIGKFVYDLKFG